MNLIQTEAAAREPVLPSGGRFASLRTWFDRHPILAMMAIAVLAVTASSYPIIFCGKSFVSPVVVSALVYDSNPVLPGLAAPLDLAPQHYSDAGAMMWWCVPVGFIESNAILDYGEIPLWNRYGHAGDILLGQAVSMLGDPLQLIVILGRGSAVAWDLKFLLAKWLFCLGCGWLVWRWLGHLPLALIFTALAAWCGAYVYIGNHPVFFVLAYAPWILLSAFEMQARPFAGVFKWGLVWLVANISCFNAGHIEVAVVLIGGLNAAALVASLLAVPGQLDRIKVLACLGGATLLFLGFTAPMWLTFLAALPKAYTVHESIQVMQLPPASFPGMFDDCFYPPHHDPVDDPQDAPGTSLLILTGCILSLLHWRQLRHERLFWVNTGAIVFWAGCVYGAVPASFIAAVPLLNRVGHVQVDFSYLLVIHLTLQCAYGFKGWVKLEDFRRTALDFSVVLAVMVLILVPHYCSSAQFAFPFGYFLACAAGAVGAPFLFKCLELRQGGVRALGWLGIVLLGFVPNFKCGMYNFGNAASLILPGPRVVLNAPSPTLSQLKSEPGAFRVTGLGLKLLGDYAAVYALEDIRSCAPLSNERFIQLVRDFPGFMLPDGQWAIMLLNVGEAHPLLNLLNVKYVLARANTRPVGEDQFKLRMFADFKVLENEQAWPRAFFASQIVPVSSTDEFVRHLIQHGDHPFAAVDRAQVEQDPDLRKLENQTGPTITAAAAHYQLLPNSTAFDIQTPAAGVVCLTEEQADDFLALANGQPVPVLTVNQAFKGIYLGQPGKYHVEFRYRPHFWGISLVLFWTSAGIVLILGAMAFSRSRPSRSPETDLK